MNTVKCVSAIIRNPANTAQFLCHQRNNGVWEFPGGKMDAVDNENLYEALEREVKEETSIDVQKVGDIAFLEFVEDQANNTIWQCYYFYVESYSGVPQHVEPDKGTEWTWLTKEELSSRHLIHSMKNIWNYVK
jgi:8-oxo-dGTP pyrophosphatase MutT (NUDIX family)